MPGWQSRAPRAHGPPRPRHESNARAAEDDARTAAYAATGEARRFRRLFSSAVAKAKEQQAEWRAAEQRRAANMTSPPEVQVRNLEGDVFQLTKELVAERHAYKELSRELTTATSELKKRGDDIKAADEAVERLEAEKAEMHNKLLGQRSRVAAEEGRSEDARAAQDDMLKALEKTEEEANMFKRQRDNQRTLCEKMKQDQRAMREQLEQLEAQLHEVEESKPALSELHKPGHRAHERGGR